MKLHLVSRENLDSNSFMVTKHKQPFFLKMWHYHSEMELVLTVKSTGTRFVGDSIKMFQPGDLVLIGKNLPHMWLNDDLYFKKKSELFAEDIVIHFKEEFLGVDFFGIKEMSHIARLFQKAAYGIRFIDAGKHVLNDMEAINKLSGFERTMRFLNLLNKIAKYSKIELLASEGYIKKYKKIQNSTMDKVYEYIFENFNQQITLKDVAKIANMNPSAFSRYFKRLNRKTFSRYLIELRIGFACKKLMERNENIAAICYESGFNNISNFNKQFKKITQKSPSEYLKQHNPKS